MKDILKNSYINQLKRVMDEQNRLARLISHDPLSQLKTTMDAAAQWAREVNMTRSAILESHKRGVVG